ncbi:MAG: type I-F CRISPR-associated protein Csy3 [Selenomonadaceae bacterium]|nr:type I-F CRISPR-associated protein Csy3 [Selenomonadaceae bacterium]
MSNGKSKEQNKIAYPSVLAFEKKLVVSHGLLYGAKWGAEGTEWQEDMAPLQIREKSVRGTKSSKKVSGDVSEANLQTVDACSLGMEQDTLVLSFTVKVLGGVETPSACNSPAFAEAYKTVAENFIAKNGFKELSRRYAINLANGRGLWRNRVGVEKLKVVITAGDKPWVIDNALSLKLREFDDCGEYETAIAEIAALIADALCGKREYLLFEVKTYALVGRGQEVYPSEELIMDKTALENKKIGSKSKVLYQVDGVAAMHSQKIGNAIRTIDTWYNNGESQPIAIDPYGAVTNQGVAYRQSSGKEDFYTLFNEYVLDGGLGKEDQENYVMAVLVRGGVFGEKG